MLLDLPWKTGDSSEQIVVQEHFTSISKDVDQAKANEFLSFHIEDYFMNHVDRGTKFLSRCSSSP